VLDPKLSETAKIAKVAFTTSTYGINEPGTVYRMDDIPIPLRPAFDSPYRSDYDILKAIEDKIRAHQLAAVNAG
jgi:formylmethanofuran dehydrogenase subunit B